MPARVRSQVQRAIIPDPPANELVSSAVCSLKRADEIEMLEIFRLLRD